MNDDFLSVLEHLFISVKSMFVYPLEFPYPIGTLSLLDIFLFTASLYMLADILESYLGWTKSDGDNR